ncbi:putative phospholipase B-like lamina ancestor [Linepithema humile]|uniref:putative phospholipase B-like lamina ancestor n=1 Tax=Linepithema humile TaxID=83485 RepID=UPI00351EDDAB
MLKVVGASWLQTRISTYILIAVALLGIGAIILGEFGHVENDGTYSATVSWNHKGGYRIDFWGQGNDLTNLRLNAARAYYKTSIFKSGWSIIEIETSSKYPDAVQAYAAGLLEGSLTWQLIHHHWHNTVNVVCKKWANDCQKLMRFLRENTAIVREHAELLAATDPFWHMVRLFYIQLDGLEAGWRFAVRRSLQTVEMDSEHFLWLAMAPDLLDHARALNDSDFRRDHAKSMIFLKNLSRDGSPLVAIGHHTAAPYAKMLRLLKKYTFGYHTLPISKSVVAPVPGRSIVMSSYPGALSSHDEFYLTQGQNRELVIAGTPLITVNRGLWNLTNAKDQVMSSARIMAANRLAIDGHSWFRSMSLQAGADAVRQWVVLQPRGSIVWLVEQLPGIVRAADISKQYADDGIFWSTGEARLRETTSVDESDKYEGDVTKNELITRLKKNVTTMERFKKFMRGCSHEEVTVENEDQAWIQSYRGDLTKPAVPFGIIDAKIILADANGVESFEAVSGPSRLNSREPFRWSKSFPNVSHIGQPDVFDFDNIIPLWVWT